MTATPRPPAEKYLLVKGRAGMGNRLLALLGGILYARLAGRTLLVDWSDRVYSQDGSNVFPLLFQCSSYDPSTPMPVTPDVVPPIWRGQLERSVSELAETHPPPRGSPSGPENRRNYSIDPGRLDYDETVAVFWSYGAEVGRFREQLVLARPRLAGVGTGRILRRTIREELALQPAIRRCIDGFKQRHFRGPTVGVHVRYTDHRTNLAAILARLDRLLADRPELQVFLATDNVQIRQLFERHYAGVIAAEHWYPRAGATLHDNRDCPDRTQEAIAALVDLHLLAECDFLIVDTSSSFARVAQMLSHTRPARIYDMRSRPKRRRAVRRALWWLLRNIGWFAWGPHLLQRLVRARSRLLPR